jgi:hypothetical protein
VQREYGPAEVLHVAEVEPPDISEGEVLVRVMAASVHAGDALLMQGIPYVMRLAFGLTRPRTRTPGLDVAGVVERVGARVSRFSVGDAVFGNGRSTMAELAAAKQDYLTAKPDGLSFEQAAALTVSGLTALKAMRDVGRVQPRDPQLPRRTPERAPSQHPRVMISDHHHLLAVGQINPHDRELRSHQLAQPTQPCVAVPITPRHPTTVAHERPPPALGHQARQRIRRAFLTPPPTRSPPSYAASRA